MRTDGIQGRNGVPSKIRVPRGLGLPVSARINLPVKRGYKNGQVHERIEAMSWDIDIIDHETGRTRTLDDVHHFTGGTYAVGGTISVSTRSGER